MIHQAAVQPRAISVSSLPPLHPAAHMFPSPLVSPMLAFPSQLEGRRARYQVEWTQWRNFQFLSCFTMHQHCLAVVQPFRLTARQRSSSAPLQLYSPNNSAPASCNGASSTVLVPLLGPVGLSDILALLVDSRNPTRRPCELESRHYLKRETYVYP